MKDTIYRDDAVALVIKAIHGTDNKEIQNYLMDGLRKQMWALPSADAVPQLNRIDTLIIADALKYLINDEERHELDRATAESLREQILKYGASMCKGGDE